MVDGDEETFEERRERLAGGEERLGRTLARAEREQAGVRAEKTIIEFRARKEAEKSRVGRGFGRFRRGGVSATRTAGERLGRLGRTAPAARVGGGGRFVGARAKSKVREFTTESGRERRALSQASKRREKRDKELRKLEVERQKLEIRKLKAEIAVVKKRGKGQSLLIKALKLTKKTAKSGKRARKKMRGTRRVKPKRRRRRRAKKRAR